jgi:hypothetical protein
MHAGMVYESGRDMRTEEGEPFVRGHKYHHGSFLVRFLGENF